MTNTRKIATLFLIVMILCSSLVLVAGCSSEKQFYTLQQAYDNGLLTQEDLLSIAYYHHGGTEGNEDLFHADYVPQPKDTKYLNVIEQNILKQTYLSEFLSSAKNATKDGVFIQQYYGVYNGYAALIMADDYSGTIGVIYYETVSNVKFLFNGRHILIWG